MRLYAGAGIFLLILMLAGGWYLYQLNYETSAEKMYSKVFETAQKAGSPSGDPAAIKGYKDLILKYPRSRAAVTAYYRLGNLYFSRREFDAAIGAYKDFLNKAPWIVISLLWPTMVWGLVMRQRRTSTRRWNRLKKR